MTLEGKRIVVIGGSSGIGLAVSAAVTRQGATVVVASSQRRRVDEAMASLPGDAEGHVLDVADPSAVEAFFSKVGAFDHLVYTAGEGLLLTTLADTDLQAAQRFFQVRYWGAYAAVKFGHPRLRPGGSVVLTSGTAGRRPRQGWSLGASICMAMEGLTRALAVELAPVRVNLVVPGLVKSPLWAGMDEADREALYAGAAGRLLTGHVGEASEVAEAYLYLMRQTYGTGQSVVVDGGGVLV